MKACIEWLWCPVFIVRAGEDCDAYGKPFDYAVAVSIPWKSVFKRIFATKAPVIVKALVATKRMDPSYALTALRLIRKAGFWPEWERFKNKKG